MNEIPAVIDRRYSRRNRSSTDTRQWYDGVEAERILYVPSLDHCPVSSNQHFAGYSSGAGPRRRPFRCWAHGIGGSCRSFGISEQSWSRGCAHRSAHCCCAPWSTDWATSVYRRPALSPAGHHWTTLWLRLPIPVFFALLPVFLSADAHLWSTLLRVVGLPAGCGYRPGFGT